MKQILSIPAAALLTILSGLLSCNEVEKRSDTPFINIEDAIGVTKSIKYSDIAKEVKYIKLETTSESLIGSISGSSPILLMEDYLLICQTNSAPLLFDTDGKFIRKIGAIGRGPGEMSIRYTALFNPGDKCIYILTDFGRDILVFNIEGQFIRSFKPDRLHTFSLVTNDLFIGAIATDPFDKTRSNNYVLFNEKGEVLNSYIIPGYADMMLPGSTPETPFGYLLAPIINTSLSGAHINTFQNDTVFTVFPDGNLKFSIYWDLGKYKSPFGPEEQISGDKSSMKKFASFITTVETGKYWIISFSLEGKQKQFVYDKSSKESFELDSIINDTKFVYAPLPFPLGISGDTYISFHQPTRLKKMIESEFFTKREKETPAEANKLRELANSLKEDDNPVLMIMRIK